MFCNNEIALMNRRLLQTIPRRYSGFPRGLAAKAHAIQAFEVENVRLLAIIQKKVDERNAIVARVSCNCKDIIIFYFDSSCSWKKGDRPPTTSSRLKS